MNIRIEIKGNKAYIYTPYNKEFIKRVKMIGDASWRGGAWVTDKVFVPAIRELLKDVYGYDDTSIEIDTIILRITFLKEIESMREGISFFGKTIAYATGRRSGAKVGEDIAFTKGYATSEGSAVNWKTVIVEGSVVIVRNVIKSIYEKDIYSINADEMIVEIIQEEHAVNAENIEKNNKIDINELQKEKKDLLERIAEIDKLLAVQS